MDQLIPETDAGHLRAAALSLYEYTSSLNSWFVILKPKLFRDGNEWCALYGENIQEGVVGFGKSPYKAMQAFDKAWIEELPFSTKEFCE